MTKQAPKDAAPDRQPDDRNVDVYFVDKVIFRYDRRETAFDYQVFSGITSRNSREYPFHDEAWSETENPKPIQLIHSGLHHPRVINPSANLIVIEDVARRLEQLPKVKLLPVEFLRVISVGMYDERQKMPAAHRDSMAFFRSLRDEPRLRAEMPKYYEVLACRLHTIWDDYDAPTVEYEFSVPKETIKICAKMFEDYPVINRSGVLLAKPVADIILPELDMRFFDVRKMRVACP